MSYKRPLFYIKVDVRSFIGQQSKTYLFDKAQFSAGIACQAAMLWILDSVFGTYCDSSIEL